MRTIWVISLSVVVACAGERASVTPSPTASASASAAVSSSSAAPTTSASVVPPPVVALPSDATAIAAAPDWPDFPFGDSMECILRASGDVACAHVELGRATTEFRPSAFRDTVRLAGGESFVCALDRAGVVRCIGDDPCKHYLDAPALEPGAAETPRVLRTPVAITELRVNEATIVMRGSDQKIYIAGLHAPTVSCDSVTTKPVPDVHSFIYMWTHAECSLDTRGATGCRTVAADRAPSRALSLSGLPPKATVLFSGQSDFEGGPTFCALGAAGELACAGLTGSFESGAAVRVVVPAARDVAIGKASLRVLTATGDVYDQALMKTPPPKRYGCAKAWLNVPTKIALDEPIAAITTGSCMLGRSGKVVCVRPGCE